jgi:hypothetical protein
MAQPRDPLGALTRRKQPIDEREHQCGREDIADVLFERDSFGLSPSTCPLHLHPVSP